MGIIEMAILPTDIALYVDPVTGRVMVWEAYGPAIRVTEMGSF